MKERQALFKGAMVCALLREIDPKTQTRRIIKIPDFVRGESSDYDTPAECNDDTTIQWLPAGGDFKEAGFRAWMTEYPEEGAIQIDCPYGKVGDRLWVRETCRAEELEYAGWEDGVRYLADNHWRVIENTIEAADAWVVLNSYRGQKGAVVPSIHMPRWASRILLEIVSVRVERLQDISPNDAIAEGLKAITKDGKLIKYGIPDLDGYPGRDNTGWPWNEWCVSPVDAYRKLWESINSANSWDANPWVWVIEFETVKP